MGPFSRRRKRKITAELNWLMRGFRAWVASCRPSPKPKHVATCPGGCPCEAGHDCNRRWRGGIPVVRGIGRAEESSRDRQDLPRPTLQSLGIEELLSQPFRVTSGDQTSAISAKFPRGDQAYHKEGHFPGHGTESGRRFTSSKEGKGNHQSPRARFASMLGETGTHIVAG